MKEHEHRLAPLMSVCIALFVQVALAENIDPGDSGSQYAWAENVGWINAEPLGNGGPGVHVQDTRLTGWMWGENVGWVSLSCENTGSCGAVDYGVTNNGRGVLGGYAWAENGGWISFACTNTNGCATSDYGVTIHSLTGVFSGKAWGENVGWISFGSVGPVPFKIETSWRCAPPPPLGDTIHVSKSYADAVISWSAETVPGPFRIYRGFRSTGVPFSYNHICITNPIAATSGNDTLYPLPGRVYYYLVSREGCGESNLGTDSHGIPRPNNDPCDSTGADRDGDGIQEALDNCPGVYNPDQSDTDSDYHGNTCDNCSSAFNPVQEDLDGDGIGDACDPDIDGDGVLNTTDNCRWSVNPVQQDLDGDGVGDVCDNCPAVANPGQEDSNGNGVGDACEAKSLGRRSGSQDSKALDLSSRRRNP